MGGGSGMAASERYPNWSAMSWHLRLFFGLESLARGGVMALGFTGLGFRSLYALGLMSLARHRLKYFGQYSSSVGSGDVSGSLREQPQQSVLKKCQQAIWHVHAQETLDYVASQDKGTPI